MDAQTKANLLAWWLQAGVVVLVAAPLPRLLGLWSPRVRMAYWRVVLVGCLLLPLLQPWVVRQAPPAALRGRGRDRRRGRALRRAATAVGLLGGSALLETPAAVRCGRGARRRRAPPARLARPRRHHRRAPASVGAAALAAAGFDRPRGDAGGDRRGVPRVGHREPAGHLRRALAGRARAAQRSSRSPSTSRRPSRATNCCTSTGPTGCGTRSTKSCAPRSGSIRPSGG